MNCITTTLLLAFLVGCESGSPEQATTTPSDILRVLAHNIHHGEGMDEVIDLQRIARS